MKPLVRHRGIAARIPIDNVDTDTIIPSREMSRVSREGLGRSLFANWRYTTAGSDTPNPEFVLNRPPFDRASVLVTGSNFGCGSSREHAAWALEDFGIRVIIAPSFGGIFESNCWLNGILPVTLPAAEVKRIAAAAGEAPIVVDLEACRIEAPGLAPVTFAVPPGRRADLMAGADAIDRTLAERAAIDAARQRRNKEIPWAVNVTE